MSEVEEIMTEIVAKRLALLQGHSEERGQLILHPGFARLIAAIILTCTEGEDCYSCTIGGCNLCPFEHSDDEPPTPCLARVAA